MARLYQAVRGDPRTAKFPIVGPSLTQGESFAKVADTARFFDFANLHNYLGGRNPGTHGWGANGYGRYCLLLGRPLLLYRLPSVGQSPESRIDREISE